ncbi:dipeptidase [Pedobacter duraquae]|uniref:Secreted protein n=1 Tax=Pedobacter duraquae TaxID=425511 RepID=A0A4R6IHA0_9SPHI|nr:membrane dipeptidase [Pedobacter duraquae]TDO21261.1 secreted protein [Pedobacter duraquae]
MGKSHHIWSRRDFITSLALAGAAGALMSNPMIAWAAQEEDPQIASIVSSMIGIDTHNHVDVPFKKEDFTRQKYDLRAEINKSGFAAICMTFCVDRPNLINEGDAYERFLTSLDEMDDILKTNNMSRALNLKDLVNAHKNKQPTVIQSVEGGHFLEGKIERLEIAYKRGLRHLGLLHDNQSAFPLGDIYTDPAKFGGLTPFGIEVVQKSNQLGILVDLAHCNDEAINDAIEVSTKPLLVSHTGLNTQLGSNPEMAKGMMKRLISKEQAKILANAGGLVGVWNHFAETPLDYAKNIRAMVDVIGVEHVCIGTDTVMASGEVNKDRPRRTTNTTWSNSKYGFFYEIVNAMLKTGFTKNEIVKIGGGNYCRIFDKATRI